MKVRGPVMQFAAGAGVVACAAALIAGCASKAPGGKSDAAHVLEAAASSVSAAKTVTIDESAVISGSTARITGGIDFSGTTLRAHLTMNRTGSANPGDLPGHIEAIMDGSQTYLSADAFSTSFGLLYGVTAKDLGGKHWVRMGDDPGSPKSSGPGPMQTPGAMIGAVSLTSDSDLVKAMTALLSSGLLVPDPASAPGEMFHYTGTLDSASLQTAKFSGSQRSAIDQAMADSDLASEQIEVWLDATGLPSEIKFNDKTKDASDNTVPSGDVKLTGWGQPVTVTVPASGDVFDFSQLPPPNVVRTGPGPVVISSFPTEAPPSVVLSRTG